MCKREKKTKKNVVVGVRNLDITFEGLGEMFDPADKCAGKFSLVSMRGQGGFRMRIPGSKDPHRH